MRILVERHIITRTNRLSAFFAECDTLTFAGKNLHNKARFLRNQYQIETGQPLSYKATYDAMKDVPEYRELPAKVAQRVIAQLLENEQSFFKAIAAYKQSPEGFSGRPKFPGYKEKDGRCTLEFNNQAFSQKELKKNGIIKLGGTQIQVKTQVPTEAVKSVRIVPQTSCYVVEVVYERPEVHTVRALDSTKVLSLDIGVDNLLTGVTLKESETQVQCLDSFILCGRELKAINQYFNKVIAAEKSVLDKRAQLTWRLAGFSDDGVFYRKGKLGTTRLLQNIWSKRDRQITSRLHAMSRALVSYCVRAGISLIAIGKNTGMKQACNLGRVNTQNFVQIPHATLIHYITYKAELEGIQVLTVEESYTSKSSALDLDILPKYGDTFDRKLLTGTRVKRGLYRRKNGEALNADVNGALNIYRKYRQATAMAETFEWATNRAIASPRRVTAANINKLFA